MRWLSRAILAAGFVFAHASSAQVIPSSTTTNGRDVDCRGLKLVSASGIPAGPTREYKLHGLCKILEVYSKTGSFASFEYDQEDPEAKTLATVWTDVDATWNSQTGDFTEDAKTQAPYAGLVSMALRCASDPVLTGVTCKGLGYSNTTGWDGFDRVYKVPRPISRARRRWPRRPRSRSSRWRARRRRCHRRPPAPRSRVCRCRPARRRSPSLRPG